MDNVAKEDKVSRFESEFKVSQLKPVRNLFGSEKEGLQINRWAQKLQPLQESGCCIYFKVLCVL